MPNKKPHEDPSLAEAAEYARRHFSSDEFERRTKFIRVALEEKS
jgi:hypothetical protein